MFSRIHDRSGRCRFRMTLGCSTEQGHTDERSPQRHYGGVVNARDSNRIYLRTISSTLWAQVRILLVSNFFIFILFLFFSFSSLLIINIIVTMEMHVQSNTGNAPYGQRYT